MIVLILAAGYATRLYPLTKDKPKPLLLVAGRPIIEHNIIKLAKIKEVTEIIVITNNKFFENFSSWVYNQKDLKVPIRIINDGTEAESQRLGAVGDINFVLEKEKIKDDIIVLAGDNLFEDELSDFVLFALNRKPSVTVGVFDIRDKAKAVKYGVVRKNEEGKIIEFREKPKDPQSSLVATCLYYIPQNKLKLFAEYLAIRADMDAAGSFVSWLCGKENIYGFVFEKHWYDIGDFSAYEEADKVFSKIVSR